ncbi:type I methionyl aminopeptidase [Phaeocystidibacter marisrubri]|uniref:Methionine aminopeptidase n=1 Tax=Phaeocystidibacter marisrubri TaxID=1577780 RepID=A0A6L3ZDN5_9FLAO|nr:type I methionyl aminopeptidase [Phaeocystidibacter marisrubri]KAB2815736.1 type I methionyl aminopeptidase [Phaeocystidibacter marisrubri]GGH65444.1 methionine aminopeptidase [Phaeocystidibacter marisrubri]
MIIYKSKEEIELMRESAQIVSRTLGVVAKEIKPGVTPLYLDKLAEDYIRSQGAEPGFLGMYDFPNTLCMSKNEVVVHGYPDNEPLREGDTISVDCGALKNGYYGDHAFTFAVGEVKPEVKKLLDVTLESLYLGIEQMRAGNRLEDIGWAIQQHAEAHGYGVVRDLVGHGIGKTMHEDPQVPNYGRRGRGKKLQEGLVLAIEPMINMGTHRVAYLKDGWTIVSGDRKHSAHFEHDVAIVDGKPDVLSTFDYVYEALGLPAEDFKVPLTR